jgi:hypothetical protein
MGNGRYTAAGAVGIDIQRGGSANVERLSHLVLVGEIRPGGEPIGIRRTGNAGQVETEPGVDAAGVLRLTLVGGGQGASTCFFGCQNWPVNAVTPEVLAQMLNCVSPLMVETESS